MLEWLFRADDQARGRHRSGIGQAQIKWLYERASHELGATNTSLKMLIPCPAITPSIACSYPLAHKSLIIRAIAIKQINQNTTGAAAPLNLSGPNSTSIGPVAILRTSTINRAASAAIGRPMIAAKCCCAVESQL